MTRAELITSMRVDFEKLRSGHPTLQTVQSWLTQNAAQYHADPGTGKWAEIWYGDHFRFKVISGSEGQPQIRVIFKLHVVEAPEQPISLVEFIETVTRIQVQSCTTLMTPNDQQWFECRFDVNEWKSLAWHALHLFLRDKYVERDVAEKDFTVNEKSAKFILSNMYPELAFDTFLHLAQLVDFPSNYDTMEDWFLLREQGATDSPVAMGQTVLFDACLPDE